MSAADGVVSLEGSLQGRGTPVYYRLEPHGPRAMYGLADTVVAGNPVSTQILLEKVDTQAP
jgi:hypothetical protein